MTTDLFYYTEAKDSAAHEYQNIATIELDSKAYEESIVTISSSKVVSYITNSSLCISNVRK